MQSSSGFLLHYQIVWYKIIHCCKNSPWAILMNDSIIVKNGRRICKRNCREEKKENPRIDVNSFNCPLKRNTETNTHLRALDIHSYSGPKSVESKLCKYWLALNFASAALNIVHPGIMLFILVVPTCIQTFIYPSLVLPTHDYSCTCVHW